MTRVVAAERNSRVVFDSCRTEPVKDKLKEYFNYVSKY